MSLLAGTRQILLNPDDVDLTDPTYIIPCFADVEPLVRSIEALGLVNRPLVQERPGSRLIPVLGRRRLQAAAILGLTGIYARVASPLMSEADGFRLAFWENFGHRTLDKASTAVVLRRLMELFPVETVADEFLPALGIPARGPRLAAMRKVGGLEASILKALADGRIQERTAVLLAEMEERDRTEAFDLINRLGTNANKSAEIVSNLHDLAIVRGQSVSELRQEEPAATILCDDKIALPERAQRFRDLLRLWKFPELVKQEREFIEWKKALSLPTGAEVRPTESFEGEECFVEIRVKSRIEAERVVNMLTAESSPPHD